MKILFQVVLLHSSVACCNMFLLVDKLSIVISKSRGLSGLICFNRVTLVMLISGILNSVLTMSEETEFH